MPLDRYMPCPGGTGKKIKFCCTELFGDLEQIQRMLEGEQRLASLEHCNKVLATHPDRACLLAIKCLLEAELDQPEQLQQTLSMFQQKHPHNPVMLAEWALERADSEGAQAGVEPLQRAIEAAGDQLPTRVYQAIGILGQMLVGDGWIMAGRAHLMLQAVIAGAEDTSAMSVITRLQRAAAVPLLLKQEYHLELPPEGSPLSADFKAALDLAIRGSWQAASDRMADLVGRDDRLPSVWHNLALLRAWLADHPGAVATLRKLAALDIPTDDAIEAEALAQLLDPARDRDVLDVVVATYVIEDAAAIQARLAADRRVVPLDLDLRSLAEEGQPPPLGAHNLLDRPVPDTAAGLTRENVPRVVGQLFVFGKQTDRSARLELIATRGAELDTARSVLAELSDPPLAAAESEEVARHMTTTMHTLGWHWQLPPDVTPDQQAALAHSEREHTLFGVWPSIPSALLDGKSPRDLVADPANRIRLAAMILNLEQAAGSMADAELFNRLRTELGVPLPQAVEPADVDIDVLPASRLARLKPEALADEDLVKAYRQAAWYNIAPALIRLAAEVVSRPSLDSKVDKAEAYGLLAGVTDDVERRLMYIESARRVAKGRGESCAPWDLAELAASITQGRVEEVDRIIQHIRTSHAREPGVAEALSDLFYRLGLIGPDGRPRRTPAAASAGGEAVPSLVVPGEEAAHASQLWTPETAAATSGGKKSVIWTPGNP